MGPIKKLLEINPNNDRIGRIVGGFHKSTDGLWNISTTTKNLLKNSHIFLLFFFIIRTLSARSDYSKLTLNLTNMMLQVLFKVRRIEFVLTIASHPSIQISANHQLTLDRSLQSFFWYRPNMERTRNHSYYFFDSVGR